MSPFKNFERGVITALITPLTKNLDIKKDVLNEIIEFQLRNGIRGFFILGTYGEGIALHPRKRKDFVEAFIEYVPSSIPVIVNISTPSIELSLELGRHAYDIGCTAISSLPPLYYRPDPSGLIKHYEYLSKIDLPVLVYNNPSKQGYDISPSIFYDIINKVSSVKGIKDSSGLPERIQILVRNYGDKYFIAAAKDTLILQAFLFGADAHICGLCNAFPEIAAEIYSSVVNGRLDRAVKLQVLITMLRDIVKRFDIESPAIVKDLMRLRGLDVGIPAPPMRRLDEKEFSKLREIIRPIINQINV